ncbi:MAG: helix-turn-helix transcriptional regulator [Clostridia bacterium]|nr:helix-turn-helix transcriptional regulator [Clostridia bacterium]
MKNYVGSKIKELRKRSGMTQAELAGKLGISSSAVGMYEQGRREPDNDTMLRLCNVFDISADDLLGQTKKPGKSVTRELSEVFDKFTQFLSAQQSLMFDGVPLNDDDKSKIVDAIKVVAAIAKQQQSTKRQPNN